MDTFAYAIDHMLAANHMEEIPYINVVSKRSFALYCTGGVSQWFRTKVSCIEAVTSLNQRVYEEKNLMRIRHSSEITEEEFRCMAECGCVAGPIRNTAVIPHLKREIFHGTEQYVICSMVDLSHVCISIPTGIPIWYRTITEWLEFIRTEDAYIIWISLKERHVSNYDWMAILRDGVNYHKKMVRETIEYPITYSKRSSEHAGLHMALDYYVLCVAEIGEMMEKCCGLGSDWEYFHKWVHQIHEIKYTQDVERIRELDEEFWEHVYEQYKSVR